MAQDGERLDRIEATLSRIEDILIGLVEALVAEAEDEPERTLDGEIAGKERDASQAL